MAMHYPINRDDAIAKVENLHTIWFSDVEMRTKYHHSIRNGIIATLVDTDTQAQQIPLYIILPHSADVSIPKNVLTSDNLPDICIQQLKMNGFSAGKSLYVLRGHLIDDIGDGRTYFVVTDYRMTNDTHMMVAARKGEDEGTLPCTEESGVKYITDDTGFAVWLIPYDSQNEYFPTLTMPFKLEEKQATELESRLDKIMKGDAGETEF